VKRHYSRFFAAAPSRLHFAAHSHHPWPDVTRDAQIAAWDDAARLADLKWERVFAEVLSEARGHIARTLDLPEANRIAFAPNTHEFVVRLLSCFPPDRTLRVVTTDSEFMSFSRQISRLEEEQRVSVVRVPAEPFSSFNARFIEAASGPANDMVFLSQVFFNSGYVVRDIETIVRSAPPSAMVVIDGYHAFFALPLSVREIADRAFFLAGGYKYAQSGEGACFLAVPRSFERFPLNTGWFAGFGELEHGRFDRVAFATDGSRFMGATFDPVGLYRFNAVARLFESTGLTIASVDEHVKKLQRRFLDGLDSRKPASLSAENLIAPEDGVAGLGHFLTFRREDARTIADRLAAKQVIVDHRGDRLRFGFGMYQDEADVDTLLTHL
jgi:kynureninase